MDKLLLVNSVAIATEIMGEAAKDLRLYGEARGKAQRSGIRAGETLHSAGFKSAWCVSPNSKGGKPLPEVVEADEVCMMHDVEYSRFQAYDALKLVLADGYMTAGEFAIWNALPAELTSPVDKATRNILVTHLGGVINDVRTSIVGYERKAAQLAEIAAAELEGREPVDLSANGANEKSKPPRDRAASKLAELIGIFQKDESPDEYDPTECVKYARGLFALIHKPDTTQEA